MPTENTVGLNMNVVPKFIKMNLRTFTAGEIHLDRTCAFSVLIIMLDGELIFYEDGQRVSLRKGQWYIQQKGKRQEGREPSKSPVYYYIHFDGEFIQNCDTSLPLEGTLDPDLIVPFLKNLYNSERSTYGSQISCVALLLSTISYLYTLLHTASHSKNLFQKAEQYIVHHFNQPHVLKQTSKAINISQAYLTRLSRQYSNTTPHQFITKLRIENACHIMLVGTRAISDIAFEVGYQDISSFYRAFLKQKHLSPRIWRKNN